MLRIERVTDVAQVRAAAHLFDHPVRSDAAERFVAEPGHHLLLAYESDVPTPYGFVSGVETTHPDKGTEMFHYELAVAPESQGRGIGTALVRALADLARERGCYGMWVLTDDDNRPALSAYRAAGGEEPSSHVLIGWTF